MTETNCGAIRDQFALYLYGELSFDEEGRVETHLDECGACKTALESQKELHAAFDGLAIEPSASMLRSARESLWARLAAEEEKKPKALWDRLVDAFALRTAILRPAGAVALLAMGFFGARFVPAGMSGLNTMSLGDPGAARVRLVEPASNGRVQIVVDETRQRTVTGMLDDANIRALLLTAVKDQSDPGLREETLTILNTASHASDVRDALLYALEHDQNAGVRMKALEGLRPFARDREVQGLLARVLINDANPGVRTQAIDLLTVGTETDFDRHVVGAVQEMMSRESNAYIRERGRRLLETVNASAEVY